MYKHGVYGEITASKAVAAAQSGTVVVYVGTAPIQKVAGYADKNLVNNPIMIRNMSEAKATFGYSDDWGKFTLCEAFDEHFNNSVENAGPIYVINVLNPATHKGTQVTLEDQDFSSGYVYISDDLADVDSVRVDSKVLGTDYSVSYDEENNRIVIKALTAITTADVNYYPVSVSAITASVIIGTSSGGVSTGIQAIKKVYTKYNAVPNILVAPGYSELPAVYTAMCAAVQKINGHWDGFVLADIPLIDADDAAVATKEAAIVWQADNGYTSERSKVCWPMVKSGTGKVYHLSTVCAATMLRVDLSHQSVPMESPSNKEIMAVGQYFGASATNEGYDDTECNDLNAVGITTACFSNGRWVLWGPHTAAFKYGTTMDARVIFDTNIRMLMHVTNGFQLRHGIRIDSPMTPAQKDTILNAENAELERLRAIGAIIGEGTVEFLESANPENDLLNGDFVFDISFTATPPFKSGTARVCYTSDGFAAFFGGE